MVEPDFEITSMDQLLEAANQVSGALTLFLGSIAGISLLVGAIGVGNIMLVSVTERTREIGTLRSIGATKSDIRLQFITEALTICLLGGLLGIIIGIIISLNLSGISFGEEDNLTAVLIKEPGSGSLSLSSDGGFTYTPNPDFSGLDTFEFAVNDGYQNSQSIQALIYVIDVDDAPVSKDDEFFVLVGQSISILPENGLLQNDTDIEGHSAEVSLVEYLGDGELTLRPDGSFDYKPAESFLSLIHI